MANFFIDTSKVDQVADNIKTLHDKCNTLLSSVQGYDTTNEGNFDFAGALSALVKNLQGADTKFNNTVALLNAVVETHGGIQNSVTTPETNDKDTSDSNTPTTKKKNDDDYGSIGCGGCGSSGGCGGYGDRNPTPTVAEAPLSTETPIEPVGIVSSTPAIPGVPPQVDDTGATDTVGLSMIDKVDDALQLLDIKEISVDDISKISKSKNTIIVEGVSSSKDCANYLVTVSEVTSNYDVSVKYIRIDKIIEDKDADTTQISNTTQKYSNVTKNQIVETYNSATSRRNDFIISESNDLNAAFVSTILIKSGYEKYNKLIDYTAQGIMDGFKEYNMFEEASSVPTPGTVIFLKGEDGNVSETGIVESVDLNGTIHLVKANGTTITKTNNIKIGDTSIMGYGRLRDTTTPANQNSILNQDSYNKLININTTNEIKLSNTPITIIIKDDKVVNSLQGVVSRSSLESAIIAAGIPKKIKS